MATDHSAATASGLDHLHIYATDFTALNNSGVDGHAVLLLDEKAQTLKVFITAEGMEPGQVHAQHIHGFPDDREAMPPTIARTPTATASSSCWRDWSSTARSSST
jgi:hypothetical protein